MKKERLDKILVDLGYFETKSKASASILAGQVKVNDEVITKAGFQLNPEKEYEFDIKTMPYVSRGGFKLQKALDAFEFSPQDRICIDAGASTGGFTDCALQHGAQKVYNVEQNLFMQLMSAMVNWLGKFVQMKELKQLKKQT